MDNGQLAADLKGYVDGLVRDNDQTRLGEVMKAIPTLAGRTHNKGGAGDPAVKAAAASVAKQLRVDNQERQAASGRLER